MCNLKVEAQLLSPDEAKIDSVVMYHLEAHLVKPDKEALKGSKWIIRDGMGNKTLRFNNNMKFKLKNNGVMGRYENFSGSWYIFNEYIVLELKKEKDPIYHIRYNGKIILVDQESINVMRRLMMAFITKDQLLSGITEETVFGFVKGYENDDK
ncbi:MAG: hypothetical protein JXR07_13670 [Reichenbachiella sp.]